MLELLHVTKKFGDFTAVDNLSLTIEKGQVVGFLGPNGAGKSTTISMISTLYRPTQGKILFNGVDLIKNPSVLQPSLGYVPQEIALYTSLTGAENLKYFGGLYGMSGQHLNKRISEVSEIIGIDDRLKNKVSQYSGGMQRRLNIGVALLHSPEFIIMDEPTVGIDPQSRNHILETVKQLNEMGITVLYTSHYMEEVSAICNYVHIMDQGKLIASGTQKELIASSDIQTALHLKFDTISEETVLNFKKMPHVLMVDRPTDTEITIAITQEKAMQDIVKAAIASEGGLISFDVVKPNLEQIFLKLTGRALRD